MIDFINEISISLVEFIASQLQPRTSINQYNSEMNKSKILRSEKASNKELLTVSWPQTPMSPATYSCIVGQYMVICVQFTITIKHKQAEVYIIHASNKKSTAQTQHANMKTLNFTSIKVQKQNNVKVAPRSG